MKNIVKIATLLTLILGYSCDNKTNEPVSDDSKTGKLSISFSLPGEARSRAIAASTSKPLTSWASIDADRVMILFVDPATSKIKDARKVSLPTTGNDLATNLFSGVIASPTAGYDAYIIGNHPASWVVANMKGRDISSLSIAAPSAADYAASPLVDTGATGYAEVEDIFVAKQTNVVVNADANNTHSSDFVLTRINSLFRIRLDVNTKAALTMNDKIGFNALGAMISLRRVATSYNLTGSTTYPIKPTGSATSPGSYIFANNVNKALNVFFKAAALKDVAPSSTTHSNVGTILTSGVSLWNEYKIFPGGSSATGTGSGKNKFDIVISALTVDATYIPAGHTSPVPEGTRVYWSGQVQEAVGPNQILELNIPFETAGTTDLPAVGEYGNLNIKASIADWGDILTSELPM